MSASSPCGERTCRGLALTSATWPGARRALAPRPARPALPRRGSPVRVPRRSRISPREWSRVVSSGRERSRGRAIRSLGREHDPACFRGSRARFSLAFESRPPRSSSFSGRAGPPGCWFRQKVTPIWPWTVNAESGPVGRRARRCRRRRRALRGKRGRRRPARNRILRDGVGRGWGPHIRSTNEDCPNRAAAESLPAKISSCSRLGTRRAAPPAGLRGARDPFRSRSRKRLSCPGSRTT